MVSRFRTGLFAVVVFFLAVPDVISGNMTLQGQFTYPLPKTTPTEEVIVSLPQGKDTISVATFNIQVFGKTKSDTRDVINVIAEIIARFDIVAIQGISDATGIAIRRLEYVIDALLQDYEFITGPRLGRTSLGEQYAFMFKAETISVGKHYTFDDRSHDHFHREPFIAQFKTQKGNFDFVLITIRTEPDSATKEINALPVVVKDAQSRFPDEKDFIVLGDLAADCKYFDEDDENSPLKSSEYEWLITNDMDTNLPVPCCSYDRIIVTAPTVAEDYAGKSGVFRFERAFGLSLKEARKVSDHYPVFSVFYVNMDTDP
jgi:endonuclease/exonuclease/phosphatase family metal-dependent hydrolase